MKTRAGKRSRSDVTGNKERLKQDMERKEGEMEVPVEDYEEVGHVADDIDCGFTSDGSDDVERALRETQDVTAEVVEQRGHDLEEVHGESEGFERELHDGSDRTASDRDRVTDTRRKVKTEETRQGVEQSLEAIQRELDFLKEHYEKVDEDRNESKRVEEALRTRVQQPRR